ncbi:MAG: nitronate monooxygenase [Actinomycetes bacterium]
MRKHPAIIQGGMGIAVSSWKLAKEVSQAGELGVISGTAIDSVIARRLQDGDLSGDTRRALSHFPDKSVAEEIIKRFYIQGGKADKRPYVDVPKLIIKPTSFALHLLIASTFVEIWLAKEAHDGLIGMNILEKIQLAIPAQLFGAMLAGVDYILIGAGIPAQIPRVLNALSQGDPVNMKIDVEDTNDKFQISFNPSCVANVDYPIKRPDFLAIVSSHALVSYLNKDEETKPDGFVIEYHVAGGHNAPPRGKSSPDENGEAIYTDLDTPNLEKVIASGSPFWLAGGFGTPEKLKQAQGLGAVGVQVGSIFALCNESGFTQEIRHEILNSLASGQSRVVTDASASPTGFPFKVIQLDETLSESELFDGRARKCDLGYLRTPFKRENGGIGYRCPGEPIDTFLFKNGTEVEAQSSKCLCNALMADIGLGQIRPDGRTELPLITIGSDLEGPMKLLSRYPDGWSARQGLDYLRMAQ